MSMDYIQVDGSAVDTAMAAKRELVLPDLIDQRGAAYGFRNPGSVEQVRQVSEEHLLELKATDPVLVYGPVPKLKNDAEDRFGAIGLRRIAGVPDAPQIVYSELAALGEAWGSRCDLPKCSNDEESIRFGVALDSEHLS